MQVVALYEPNTVVTQALSLPGDESPQDIAGQTEGAEEPLTLIAPEGTRTRVPRLCQLRVSCRRTKCSAATAARERIACRSAG